MKKHVKPMTDGNAGQFVNETRVLESLIRHAIADGASDIHVDPDAESVKVRFRVDGVLRQVAQFPKGHLASLINRARVMADLDTVSHVFPLEGSIAVQDKDRGEFELRLVIMPTLHGERAVFRILAQASMIPSLERTGLGSQESLFRRLIERSSGLVLFAGPSGSGKTTVLFSALKSLDVDARNIILLGEKPYCRLPGVTCGAPHASVESLAPLLAEADYDVIAVSDLYSRSQIESLLDAALAGSLTMGALHAINAAHAFDRLLKWGIARDKLAAGLAGIIASRLARRVCETCREPYSPDSDTLHAAGILPELASGVTFYRAAGCDACGRHGYRGRIALFEILDLDTQMRETLTAGGDVSGLLAAPGRATFLSDGAAKAAQGITTLDEVLRVSY